jgi:hypothetical protein
LQLELEPVPTEPERLARTLEQELVPPPVLVLKRLRYLQSLQALRQLQQSDLRRQQS